MDKPEEAPSLGEKAGEKGQRPGSLLTVANV